ncbi:MAG TPA: glycosyltransferase family 9 protein [Nitrospiraceae bacterium]|nr:glycosyltransferase family 9 protein [Nitrospiraceae bacterium]
MAVSKQVLILNITRIGDLVQTVPLISRLHQEWPDVAIDLVVDTRCAVMAALLPGLRHVFSEDFETRLPQGDARTSDEVTVRRDIIAWAKFLQGARYDRVINLTFTPASGVLAASIGVPDTRGLMTRPTGAPMLRDPWLTYLVDLHQYRRLNRFNLVDLYALGGSGPGAYTPMRLRVPSDAEEWACRYLKTETHGRHPLAVQVGASDPVKAWRPEYFGRTMAAIHRCVDVPFLLTGAPSEATWAKQAISVYRESGGAGVVCDAVGRTDLGQLAALLARCRLLLTNDTGPMHVAVAVGTPVIDLSLGSFYFRETGPYGPGHLVVQPDIPCAPCVHDSACAHHACKDQILTEQVAALTLSLLGQQPFPSRWTGVHVYESRIDEDGLIAYELRAGRIDTVDDRYGVFWRRFWYETFTGQASRIPSEPSAPDLVEQQHLFYRLVPAFDRLVARADHVAQVTCSSPFPVATFKAAEAQLSDDRQRVMTWSLPSPAFGPIAVALTRELHNGDGLALQAMAGRQAHAYRRLRDRARAVMERLEGRTAVSNRLFQLATEGVR